IELPGRTVETVAARFRGHVDHTARGAPILGREVAGDYAILLHRVHRDLLANDGTKNLCILHAVQQNLGARFPLAIDAVAHALVRGTLTSVTSDTGALIGGVIPVADIAGKRNKVVNIARQAGQLRNLLYADQLRELLRLRIYLSHRSPNYLNHSRTLANLQFGIHRRNAADRDFHGRPVGLKVRARNGQLIISWRKGGNRILTDGSRRRGSFGSRRKTLCCYRGARHDGAGRVPNSTGNRPSLHLAKDQTYGQHQAKHDTNECLRYLNHESPPESGNCKAALLRAFSSNLR